MPNFERKQRLRGELCALSYQLFTQWVLIRPVLNGPTPWYSDVQGHSTLQTSMWDVEQCADPTQPERDMTLVISYKRCMHFTSHRWWRYIHKYSNMLHVVCRIHCMHCVARTCDDNAWGYKTLAPCTSFVALKWIASQDSLLGRTSDKCPRTECEQYQLDLHTNH